MVLSVAAPGKFVLSFFFFRTAKRTEKELPSAIPQFATEMAPVKRKRAIADESTTRQPQKRVRVGADERKKNETKVSDLSTKERLNGSIPPARRSTLKDSELSVVRDDEPVFPRGGGNVLTPLERKQIQVQATRDVLFKESGGSTEGLIERDDNVDVGAGDVKDGVAGTQKSRKTRSKGNKGVKQEAPTKQDVRVESLGFKVYPAGYQTCFMG
jgi:rRNA biogenesis protein RRP5